MSKAQHTIVKPCVYFN